MELRKNPISNHRHLFFLLLCLFVLVIVPAACAAEKKNADQTVVSEDEQISDPQLQKERKIGRKAVAEIESHWELDADPALLVRLSMIVDRLKTHMTRSIPYEVRVIRMDVPNAFCLPGGFVFFTTGMLKLLHSDAEIAAVMAHEMIHVDQNHGLKMAAKSNRLSLAALAVILVSGGALAPTVLAQVAQVAMNSSYTIEFEKEADSKGLDALIAAGYPPTAMVTVMESFMHEEMKQPIREYGIYMDHPESVERVEAMSAKLKALHINLERKYPLLLLRTAVRQTNGRASLLMDGVEVWGGPDNETTLKILNRSKVLLDRDFEMELAPYDLQLEGNNLLRLKNDVLAQAPLPFGMQDLKTFRENLLAALARAQKQHPIANYFR